MNISAINAELAKIGYKAVRIAKPNRAAAWKPQTPAGRACKAAMIRWAKWPKPIGVKDYQVRGADGQWYREWQDGFAPAVEYQKLCTEWAYTIKTMGG